MSIQWTQFLQALDFQCIYSFLDYDDIQNLLMVDKLTNEIVRAWDAIWYAKLDAFKMDPKVDRRSRNQLLNFLENVDNIQYKCQHIQYGDPVPEMNPYILDGVTESWSANWSFDQWVERFGEESFRFDDRFGEVIKLRYFKHYLNITRDKSPIGIYDSQFGSPDRVSRELLDEYQVPKYFSRDIFDELDDESRPPYRWVLIGGAGGGTEMHVDPLYTSAWVTLMEGHKRWCMFPPDTLFEGHETDQVLEWFYWFYFENGRVQYPDYVEIFQYPGETVYVPAGWPHIVINLDTTISITQNFASEMYRDRVFEEHRVANA